LEGLLFKYILDNFRSGGVVRMDGGSVWCRRIELGLLYTLWIEENIWKKDTVNIIWRLIANVLEVLN